MDLKPFTLNFSGGKQKQLKPTQEESVSAFSVNGSFPVEVNK